MIKSRYLVQVKAVNTRLEVRINDIPVGMYAPGQAESTAEVPINEFLLSGTNRITVIAHANPLPSRALLPWTEGEDRAIDLIKPSNLEVTLLSENPVDSTTAPEELNQEILRFSWSGLPATTPLKLEKTFEIPRSVPIPAWAWTRAHKFLAPNDAIEHGLPVLQQLWQMLAEKKVDLFSTVTALKLEEITTGAYGVPVGPLRTTILNILNRNMNNPDWILLPCGDNDVDLRLVADGRLIQCLRPDGKHALTYVKKNSTATSFFPAMLGNLDGKWKVLR